MPEFPDIELYLHALRPRIAGQRVARVRLASPFLVRSFDPPIQQVEGRVVVGMKRLGKRIVWELEGSLFLIFHLMIAGRFRWKPAGTAIPGKVGLAAFDFEHGALILTEAGSKRQASLHVVAGAAAAEEHDPGGLEVLDATPEDFAAALRRENHTLKRALTDPHLLSGIGNAYSDEILHAARLSPMKLTAQLTDDEIDRVRRTAVAMLTGWRDRLIAETGDDFPERVTAFRPEMAVHGKFGTPCPVCGTPVQRIRYAANEANYCPTCQTDGKLLADRSLSRLMKGDWPKTLEELEKRRALSKAPKETRTPKGRNRT